MRNHKKDHELVRGAAEWGWHEDPNHITFSSNDRGQVNNPQISNLPNLGKFYLLTKNTRSHWITPNSIYVPKFCLIKAYMRKLC